MNRHEELVAVTKVVHRLAAKYPHIQLSHIEQAAREEYEDLDGRPVRDFVPVLVEHGVKERLRGMGVETDTDTDTD